MSISCFTTIWLWSLRWPIVALLFIHVSPLLTRAQTESTLVIRVESNQVLVPTFVFDKARFNELATRAENRCFDDNEKALAEMGVSVRYSPSKCWAGLITNLAPKQFHLFEDGAEETIQSVIPQHWHEWDVSDNFGHHREYSGTPRGKWSTSELGALFSPPLADDFYIIAYTPPASPAGSCHQIRVTVDRPNSWVYTRSQYCNTTHSPVDPLKGTAFSQQLKANLDSPKKGKIELSAYAGIFFSDSDTAYADLVLEFPWNSLHREWVHGNRDLYATIGVLGLVCRKDGTVATRFSDQACCPSDVPFGHSGEPIYDTWVDAGEIPARFETQIDLSDGQYDVRAALSDGIKFGRVHIPLTVETDDKKQLAISSIALCRRVHKVDPPSYTEGILPSKFVPLVSKGLEFTPSADTVFKKSDPMFAYFEVREPRLAGTDAALQVQFEMRITNVKTGELKTDTGLRSADSYVNAGSLVIPIAEQIAVKELPKGQYRMEVQASDSTGAKTQWRAVSFSIQ